MSRIVGILRRPSPLAAAVANGVVGFVFPMIAVIVLYSEVIEFGVPAPPLRWLIGAGPVQALIAVATGGALGVTACAVLFWARRDCPSNPVSAFALVSMAFAISAVAALIGGRLYWHGYVSADWYWIRGPLPVAAIFAGCGGFMALALAGAARRLGASPPAPSWRIALLGAGMAGIGMAVVPALFGFDLMFVLAGLWLGTVTYFCLKPGRKGAATAFDNGGPVA